MPSSLVLSAYFAMLLSPCLVTQWGDLLSVRWVFAFARRRRTHSAESFMISFRAARFSAALAREAAYAVADSELLAAPKPFLVGRRAVPVETLGFIEARQRVAARLGQLVVAQKLRSASEVTETATVPTPASIPAMSAAAPVTTHILPRKPVPVVHYEPAVGEPAYASVQSPDTTLHESLPQALPELEKVAGRPPGAPHGPEIVPALPRYHRRGDSNVYEIAA